MDAIKDALEAESLLAHQRRLMAMLSLGTQHMIELYLHRKAVLKPGSQVKHEWFKLSEQRLNDRMSPLLTKRWTEIPRVDEIIRKAHSLELQRNDIVYGAPLPNDEPLRKHIQLFLEIKAMVEEETEQVV